MTGDKNKSLNYDKMLKAWNKLTEKEQERFYREEALLD
jgi:hypothetical protein